MKNEMAVSRFDDSIHVRLNFTLVLAPLNYKQEGLAGNDALNGRQGMMRIGRGVTSEPQIEQFHADKCSFTVH